MKKISGIVLTVLICGSALAAKFTETFGVDKADLASTGSNRFFILTPGFQATFEGKEGGKQTVLTITVLNETKMVDGVETRVVEEREVAEGQLAEVSRNFFAISRVTGDVYYFGEDSETYKNGKVSGIEGSWLSGENGAHFGLAMPATPLLGARYFQEQAPKVAMDRAEVTSLDEKFETPAGHFENCLKTVETSAVEAGRESKLYSPGIGLILDGDLKLTKVVRGNP
jgi:hypothetical protein